MAPHPIVQAIDVHAHYGHYNRPGRELASRFGSADAATVASRAADAYTRYTVVSPLQGLMPRGHADPVAGNEDAARVVAEHDGLLQWVIIDPRTPRTYEQADTLLQSPRCVGIKIHPEEHRYHIRDFGDDIFRFAAEREAVVLTHSGESNSMPMDFTPFADRYRRVRLILAHIGCGWDGDLGHQVRAICASRWGNVFADTSSATSITPNLIEWAVQQCGADRILYGSDAPLYCAWMQRTRIDRANLSPQDKLQILRGNASALLGLPASSPVDA